jgi:hypothetical protein
MDYIGTTGLYPIYEYIDDVVLNTSNTLNNTITNTSNTLNNTITNTSNDLNNTITNTSNDLINNITNTSNALFDNTKITSNNIIDFITSTKLNLQSSNYWTNSHKIQNNFSTITVDLLAESPSVDVLLNKISNPTQKSQVSDFFTNNTNHISSFQNFIFGHPDISLLYDTTVNNPIEEDYIYSYSNVGIKTNNPDLNYAIDINGNANISGDLYINKNNLTKTLITKPSYIVWDATDVLELDDMSITINGSNIKVKTKSWNPYQDGITNADDFSTFASIAYLLQNNSSNINNSSMLMYLSMGHK